MRAACIGGGGWLPWSSRCRRVVVVAAPRPVTPVATFVAAQVSELVRNSGAYLYVKHKVLAKFGVAVSPERRTLDRRMLTIVARSNNLAALLAPLVVLIMLGAEQLIFFLEINSVPPDLVTFQGSSGFALPSDNRAPPAARVSRALSYRSRSSREQSPPPLVTSRHHHPTPSQGLRRMDVSAPLVVFQFSIIILVRVVFFLSERRLQSWRDGRARHKDVKCRRVASASRFEKTAPSPSDAGDPPDRDNYDAREPRDRAATVRPPANGDSIVTRTRGSSKLSERARALVRLSVMRFREQRHRSTFEREVEWFMTLLMRGERRMRLACVVAILIQVAALAESSSDGPARPELYEI